MGEGVTVWLSKVSTVWLCDAGGTVSLGKALEKAFSVWLSTTLAFWLGNTVTVSVISVRLGNTFAIDWLGEIFISHSFPEKPCGQSHRILLTDPQVMSHVPPLRQGSDSQHHFQQSADWWSCGIDYNKLGSKWHAYRGLKHGLYN